VPACLGACVLVGLYVLACLPASVLAGVRASVPAGVPASAPASVPASASASVLTPGHARALARWPAGALSRWSASVRLRPRGVYGVLFCSSLAMRRPRTTVDWRTQHNACSRCRFIPHGVGRRDLHRATVLCSAWLRVSSARLSPAQMSLKVLSTVRQSCTAMYIYVYTYIYTYVDI